MTTELEQCVSDTFELLLLDGRSSRKVVAVGRRDVDTAIEHIPLNARFKALLNTGRGLGAALGGTGTRPNAAVLRTYGEELFHFLFRNALANLYNRAHKLPVCVQILSDHPEINEVPWEFLMPPGSLPMPHRDRSVIRVHPTCGVDRPERRLTGPLRVLLVVADPVHQTGIGAAQFIRSVRRIFDAYSSDAVKLNVVEGATRASLLATLRDERFDVLHFYGHGDTAQGVGRLVLQGVNAGNVDYLEAPALASALSGRGIQLAILSACYSAAGNHANPLNVTATALIGAGIPAVLANQYAIPYKTVAPFVANVYRSLLEHGDIDVAVAEARVMLAAELTGSTLSAPLEWGIPVLYRLSNAQQLFER